MQFLNFAHREVKNMSKKKKVALGVIFSILFIIIIAIVANFDFILMLKDGLFETQDNISIKKEEVKNKQQEALEDAGVSNVRPLTEEETKAHKRSLICSNKWWY